MRVLVLDCPRSCIDAPGWSAVEDSVRVDRYPSTTLFELLERGRLADVLVSFAFPLRREVLDYVTRPHLILVPEGARSRLVEERIARQLGLEVAEFPFAGTDCGWIAPLLLLIKRAG